MPQRLWILLTLLITVWTAATIKHFPRVSAIENTKPAAAITQWQDNVLVAEANPVTIHAQWPVKRRKPFSVRRDGQCATFAKAKTGIVTNAPVARLTMSYAKKAGYETSTDTPFEGGIVQTSEGRVGHVAKVTKVEDSVIHIEERNYRCAGCVGTRTLSIDDPVIQGFIAPR
jgi:surface antigen